MNLHHTRCFVPSLVEIGSVVLEKRFLKFFNVVFAISLLSTLGKGCGPSFEQSWISFSQECFVLSLVEICSVGLEKKILKVFIFNAFCYFITISSWKRVCTFIFPSPKDALCQVCWNWPSGFWAEDENVKCLQTDGGQDRRMTDNGRSEILTWTFSSDELKLIFVYHYPSLRKQLTRHCCKSLHSWQVNCLLSSFVASFIIGRSIWSSLIKYYIHNEDYCWIWQMKKKLQEVKVNKGFDCLNVMFI